MSKPLKQQFSGVACIIDGIIARRVQTFGVAVDITREQTQELANAGVVEYISDSPTVSIQIDTNDVGSVDTLSLLTDTLIHFDGDDVGTNCPLGGTGRYFIKADSANARTIDQDDMLNGYFSILATLNEEGTSAARTMWCNHCALTGVSYSYDVNGNASENYTVAADNKTWFFNNAAGVRCYKPLGYQMQHATAGIRFVMMSSCVPDDCSVAAIGVNNDILRSTVLGGGVTANLSCYVGGEEGSDGMFMATAFAALSTPWVSTVAGSTDRVWIIYKPSGKTWEANEANDGNVGFELESAAAALGAVRRGKIKAYIYNTDVSGKASYSAVGKALRLQSVAIDVALGEEQLLEIGTEGFYGISKTSPVPITVTISAVDSDLQYFAHLASIDEEVTTNASVQIGDFNGLNGLRIEIYQDAAQTILLKTIECNTMYVQSENFNVAVGDNATQEITFTCDNVTITGQSVDVTGGPNWQ